MTPVHLAARHGHSAVITEFVKQGISLRNLSRKTGMTVGLGQGQVSVLSSGSPCGSLLWGGGHRQGAYEVILHWSFDQLQIHKIERAYTPLPSLDNI